MSQNALFLAISVICATCLYQCGCRSITDTDVFFLDADSPLKADEQDSLEDIEMDLRELAPHLRYGKEVAPHVRYGKEVAPHVRYGKEVRQNKSPYKWGKDYAVHGNSLSGPYKWGKDYAVHANSLLDLASRTPADDKAEHDRNMLAIMKTLRDVASGSTKSHRKRAVKTYA